MSGESSRFRNSTVDRRAFSDAKEAKDKALEAKLLAEKLKKKEENKDKKKKKTTTVTKTPETAPPPPPPPLPPTSPTPPQRSSDTNFYAISAGNVNQRVRLRNRVVVPAPPPPLSPTPRCSRNSGPSPRRSASVEAAREVNRQATRAKRTSDRVKKDNKNKKRQEDRLRSKSNSLSTSASTSPSTPRDDPLPDSGVLQPIRKNYAITKTGAPCKKGARKLAPSKANGLDKEALRRNRIVQNVHHCPICPATPTTAHALAAHIRFECPRLPKTQYLRERKSNVYSRKTIGSMGPKVVGWRDLKEFRANLKKPSNTEIFPITLLSIYTNTVDGRTPIRNLDDPTYEGHEEDEEYLRIFKEKLASGVLKKVLIPACFYAKPGSEGVHPFDALRDLDHISLIEATFNELTGQWELTYHESCTAPTFPRVMVKTTAVAHYLQDHVFGGRYVSVPQPRLFDSVTRRGCGAVVLALVASCAANGDVEHPTSRGFADGIKMRCLDAYRRAKHAKK